MSVLTLVRHGQASYMAEDYDRLSALGEEQARKLGEFWVRHRIQFDLCFHGPAKRHKQTLEIASQHVRQAGLSWPESQAVPELDEFDAFRMMQLLTPKLVESDPEMRRLSDVFEANRHTPEAGRMLQKLFEAVSRSWCSGVHDTPGVGIVVAVPGTDSSRHRSHSEDIGPESECRGNLFGRSDRCDRRPGARLAARDGDRVRVVVAQWFVF